MAITGQQDNLRPPDMLLATIPIGYHRLQRATVGGIQCSVMWVLSCIPQTRMAESRKGILKRIEMSDLVH